MKILKFKKISKDKYKIYLNNGDEITLFDEVIINNNLLLTKEIDDKKLDLLINQNSIVYAHQLSLGFISIRIRSKKEIEDYLLKKGISNKLIDITINKLQEEGYLNDFDFSKAYVNDQMKLSNIGPYRIRNNLIKYGISEKIIDEIMQEIDYKKIIEKLSKLIEKQIRIKKGSSNMIKTKLVNYFINLGYDKDMILNVLSNYDIKSDKQELRRDYDKLYNKYKNKYKESKLTYFIAGKLYSKGYTQEDITNVIKENNF